MKRLVVALSAAALVAVGGDTHVRAEAPARTLEVIRSTAPPVRDLADLRRRVPNEAPTGRDVVPDGYFWVHDIVQHTYNLVAADLVHASQHADWYVERGREPNDVRSAAEYFEVRTFPLVTRYTGVTWTPGADGQPKLAIYLGRVPGVAGYMSSGDLYPRWAFPHSNQRPIVYLSLDSLRPGTGGFNGTLAHELEHLAHSIVNPGQQGWLDEGLAELVAKVVTENSGSAASGFRGQPDVQLNAWSEKPWEARAHYEASYLWARYLMERGGGPDALADLARAGGQGLETVERYARARGIAGGGEGLFRDWLVANLLDDTALADGRYGYGGLDQRSATVGLLRVGDQPIEGQVHQFAADYLEVDGAAPVDLVFEGTPSVALIPAAEARGTIFWSLRGDNVDTKLTRRFDLSGVQQATLRYRLWFDLEPDYDYCYTLASRDGLLWSAQPGRHTANRNSAGQSLGPGYTGTSAGQPGWVDEEVDLGAFAGAQVWIRFECVTDQGFSGPGLALDHVEIPEIGFFDDAEADRAWTFDGFVRTPNEMAQPAFVLAVDVAAGALTIRELTLDGRGNGVLSLPAAAPGGRRYVVIAGLAPTTLEQMAYRVWLRQAP
jgi:hypothetical protein